MQTLREGLILLKGSASRVPIASDLSMTLKTAVYLTLLLLVWCNSVDDTSAKESGSAQLTKERAEELIFKMPIQPVSGRAAIPKVFWEPMNLENISDPKGSFSSGCTGPGSHTRMLAAGIMDNYVVMLYEQGGIAYFRRLQVYRKDGNKVECVYNEMVSSEERIERIQKRLTK